MHRMVSIALVIMLHWYKHYCGYSIDYSLNDITVTKERCNVFLFCMTSASEVAQVIQ